MFNIVQVKGDDAGGYYGTQANYYLGGEAPSNWVGQGAEALGFKGPVDPGQFTQLMNGAVQPPGQDPVQVLSGVRKGWDMTISAPKWASVMITLGGDKRLAEHWKNAAQTAFNYVERFATHRKSVDGKQVNIVGARLIGGAFLHDANRNNEPSIHVHMVASAIGVTKDGKLRAVDLQHAYKHAKLIGQLVHAKFAHTARRDGYQVGLDDKGMAMLENAPQGLQDVSEALSTRRDEVRSEIDRLGVATRQGEVAVVRATRDANSPDAPELLGHAEAIATAKNFGPEQIKALIPDTRLPLKEALAGHTDGTLPSYVQARLDRAQRANDQKVEPTPETAPTGVLERLGRQAVEYVKEAWNALNEHLKGKQQTDLAAFPAPTLQEPQARKDVFQPKEDYPLDRLAARHELAYQIRRVSERQAAFALHEVALPTIIAGLKDDLPGVTPETVHAAARDLTSEGLIKIGRDRKALYTATALEIEREDRIHAFTTAKKGTGDPALSRRASEKAMRSFEQAEHPLTKGQRQLVGALIASKDRFVSVQGGAGTGKTTAIRAARTILDDHKKQTGGARLYGLANTKAARDEIRAQGIEARTTAAFLSRFTRYFHTGVLPAGEDKAAWENTILVFDETSFAGNADMEAAMAIADRRGGRSFVSQGDVDQLPAIPAGNVPDLIGKLNLGFNVTLGDIVRQTNPDLRDAIQSLVGARAEQGNAKGYVPLAGARDVTERLQRAVPAWGRAGAITDLNLDRATDSETRKEQLQEIAETVAGKWRALSRDERAETLIIFPTHELRALYHDSVRETLRAEGEITGEDREQTVLRPKPLSAAEKDRSNNYAKGDTLVFSQYVSRIGARPGDRFVVDDVNKDANSIQLSAVKGESHGFKLSDGLGKLPRFEVFREAKASFAIGDRIRILPGDPRNLADGMRDLRITKEDGHGLYVTGRVNSDEPGVESEAKTLRLANGSTTLMMVDHDYSRTVYAAQGLSALRVLAGFHSQSIMTSFANLYVIGSRAKEALSIITDSLERAIDAVAHNPGVQMSAHTAMDHIDVDHFISRAKAEMETASDASGTEKSDPDRSEQNRDVTDQKDENLNPGDRSFADERPADLEQEQTLDLETDLAPGRQPDREIGD